MTPGTIPSAATRRAVFLVTVANLFVAMANTSPLLLGRGLATWRQTAFAVVAMLGWIGLCLFVIGGALALVARRQAGTAVVRFVAPAVFTLVQAALFLDVRIYGMFRFHFNGVVWHTLNAPGGWDSLHIPTADVLVLALGVAALGVFQSWTFRRLELSRLPGWFTWKQLALVLAVFGITDRVTFATFDLMRDYEIVRAARVVPGYQPFTVRQFASSWFGWQPGAADSPISGGTRSSGLAYPRRPLAWNAPVQNFNILWVVLESWRHDAMSEEHSPEIWEIAKKARVFENHSSAGNNTTFGVFSMFYGLYGSYRSAFLSEHRSPVLIDRLRELDYRFAIYSSFPMTWPEFRKYVFVDIADSVKDEWPKDSSAKNDPLVIDAMLSFIDDPSKVGQPFFGYVHLDSSHAPYTFPPEFGKFEPYTRDAKLVRYIDVTQRAPEMRNRYFNAVLWESHEVGRLWSELERRGLLENTVVLITGDHGEEFNERGFWTHSGGFTPEQIDVPALLWWPRIEHEKIRTRTTHKDLAATFLEALGVENPPSDYSQGHSLLHPEAASCDVSCGWRDCAAADDSGYVVFGLESHDSMNFDVLDSDYEAVADPRAAMAGRTECMLSVMQGLGAFLK